jgi:hypothetical protein
MAIFNSSRTFFKAPTSSQDTSGTVAKPSRLLDGWTRWIAILHIQIFSSKCGIIYQIQNYIFYIEIVLIDFHNICRFLKNGFFF